MGMLGGGGGGEGQVGYVRADGHAGGGSSRMENRAGESSRKPRRPRPYSRRCMSHCAQISPISPSSPCAYHAPRMPHTYVGSTVFTTTRHAASLRSSKNLNCVIETSLPVRNASYKRLPPPGLSPRSLENGGFKPIFPFLGGRSDAACRVVIWPSCLSPMETYGLYHGTTLVREGTREKGEHSLCSASPLPRTK